MAIRKETNLCVWHCSATKPDQDIGVDEIRDWHVNTNGWSDIGYHWVIKRDGQLYRGRSEVHIGAHSFGHNYDSISVCLVGGIDDSGASAMNFTPQQERTMFRLKERIDAKYPGIEHLGHRDLSPDLDGDGVIEKFEWLKDCPCFDVKRVFALGTLFGVDGVLALDPVPPEPEAPVVMAAHGPVVSDLEPETYVDSQDGLLGNWWNRDKDD